MSKYSISFCQQNVIWIRVVPFFGLQNSYKPTWYWCNKSCTFLGDRLYEMFKQLLRKSGRLQYIFLLNLSYRSWPSQICSIGLNFVELVGQEINWSLMLFSWNYSSTIRAMPHGMLSCSNTPFSDELTDTMQECNLF